MKIGIIGLGSVGLAAKYTLEKHYDVRVYDIDGRGSWNDVIGSNAILVCVSTNEDTDGTLDMRNILSVARDLEKSNYGGLMIIKSTLQPGTVDIIEKLHPSLRVAYVPEFLREKDAVEWFGDPDRLVYSCNKGDEELLMQIFNWIGPKVPRLCMSNKEAELGKLAHNAYIATKVTFTCEIERLCKLSNIDAKNVMEVVWRDRRVNNSSHLTPGKGGFGGKCVPKDTQALAKLDPDVDSLLHILHNRGGEKSVHERLM